MDVQTFTVGPVAENCYIVSIQDSAECIVFDPGEEVDRLLDAINRSGKSVAAILVTHTHFDHVGAVAPLAKATGAPVYCPKLEAFVLEDIMKYVPWPEFGPFESYTADEVLSGGEILTLAGLEIEVLFTPGHSPGHISYLIESENALFSGDVLFAGSIGRTDLPGGDMDTLLSSIESLMASLPPETKVYPGHMGETTLVREKTSNPFLRKREDVG